MPALPENLCWQAAPSAEGCSMTAENMVRRVYSWDAGRIILAGRAFFAPSLCVLNESSRRGGCIGRFKTRSCGNAGQPAG